MARELTLAPLPATACPVCSNGAVQLYHQGGPCPYVYAGPQPGAAENRLPDGEYRVIGGRLYRLMLETPDRGDPGPP